MAKDLAIVLMVMQVPAILIPGNSGKGYRIVGLSEGPSSRIVEIGPVDAQRLDENTACVTVHLEPSNDNAVDQRGRLARGIVRR